MFNLILRNNPRQVHKAHHTNLGARKLALYETDIKIPF